MSASEESRQEPSVPSRPQQTPFASAATPPPSPGLRATSTEDGGGAMMSARADAEETQATPGVAEPVADQPWWATTAFAAPSTSPTATFASPPSSSASGQGRRVIRARATPSSPTPTGAAPAFPLASSESTRVAVAAAPVASSPPQVLKRFTDPTAAWVDSGEASPQHPVATRQAKRREGLPPLFAVETHVGVGTGGSTPSSSPPSLSPPPQTLSRSGPVNLFAKATTTAAENAKGLVAFSSKADGSESAGRSRASTPVRPTSPTTLHAYSVHSAGAVGNAMVSDRSNGRPFSRIRATLQSTEQAVRATTVSPPAAAPAPVGSSSTFHARSGSSTGGGAASRHTAGSSWSRPAPRTGKKDAEDVEYTFTVMESSSNHPQHGGGQSGGDGAESARASSGGGYSNGSRRPPLARAPNGGGGVWENPFGATSGRTGTNASATPLNIWSHEGGFLRSIFGRNGSHDAAVLGAPSESDRGTLFAQEGRHLTSLFATEVEPARPESSPHGSGGGCGWGEGVGGSGGRDGAKGNNCGGDGGGGFSGDDDDDSVVAREQEREAERELERMYAARAFRTRNLNALRAYSWDQRIFLPSLTGWFSAPFGLVASPRFWEKLDWALRASVLTIFPTLVLCMEETTRGRFPLPTSVVAYAFWISQPTLGAGLRELYVVLKGFSVGLVSLIIFIAINPGPPWLSLLILWAAILVGSFVAEGMKRTVAYVLCSLIMQYVSSPTVTTYEYVGDYFLTLLIALGFGLAAFFVPYIRWSSDVARHYIGVAGDSISLGVRGLCGCFWTRTALERRLHLSRIRQLEATVDLSLKKAGDAVSEMGYEPHSGVYTAQIKTRMAFIKGILNVMKSMVLVIDMISDSPSLIDTDMCNAFGARIRGELAIIGAAMDATLLKIADLTTIITAEDIERFKAAKDRYEDAVSQVRQEVILNNDDYVTDHSDVLLGFYLFSIEELCDLLCGFKENTSPPNNLVYLLTFPVRDLRSTVDAFRAAYSALVRRSSLTRRLKEAIKLSTCIIVAAYFQVYGMKNSSTSPVAGVDIIALVYKPTGAESFQYATNRLLGTVLGSLTGLLAVQIADGGHAALYAMAVVLCFIGTWVQSAPGYFPLGNAICNSVISIVIQFRNPSRAMVRIQQNCFAILTYFVISSLIWPMRARTKVHLNFDISMRMFREAVRRLLENLDMPESGSEVSSDALALIGEMGKKVGVQAGNLGGAAAEPTLDSAEFPEIPWRGIINAQRKLNSTLLMMRHAYHTFMTSTVGNDLGLSVHWVILHRIAPYANELSELVYAACDIYILALTAATVVPTAHLSRIRHGMIRCQRKIILTYINTIRREVKGDVDSRDDGDDSLDDEEANNWSDSTNGGGGDADSAADDNVFGHSKEAQLGLRTQTMRTPSLRSRGRSPMLHRRMHSTEGASLTSTNVAKPSEASGPSQPLKRRRPGDVPGPLNAEDKASRRHRRREAAMHASSKPAAAEPVKPTTPATTTATNMAALPAPSFTAAATVDLAMASPARVRRSLADGSMAETAPPALGATTRGPLEAAAVSSPKAPTRRKAGSGGGGYLAYRMRPEEEEVLRTLIGNASFLDPAVLTNNSIVRIPAEFVADTATNHTVPSLRGREHAHEAGSLGGTPSNGAGSRSSGLSPTERSFPSPRVGNRTFAGPGLGINTANNSFFLGRTLGAGRDLFDVRPGQRKSLFSSQAAAASSASPLTGLPQPMNSSATTMPSGVTVTPCQMVGVGPTHGDLQKSLRSADARPYSMLGGDGAPTPAPVRADPTSAGEAPAAVNEPFTEGGTAAEQSRHRDTDPAAAPPPSKDAAHTFARPSDGSAAADQGHATQASSPTWSAAASTAAPVPAHGAEVDYRKEAQPSVTQLSDLTEETRHPSAAAAAAAAAGATTAAEGPREEPVTFDDLNAEAALSATARPAHRPPSRLSGLLARMGGKKKKPVDTASHGSVDNRSSSAVTSHSEGGGQGAEGRRRQKAGAGAGGGGSGVVPPEAFTDDDEDGGDSSSVADLVSSRMAVLDPDQVLENLPFFNAEQGEFILTNRDIHSLEAFLFGIRVLVTQTDEMEKHLLAMIHSNEMAQKL